MSVMPRATISTLEYYLPSNTLTNDNLAEEFPEWNAAKIASKTGINIRHIASRAECSSDLAVAAARKIFDGGVVKKEDIEFLLFCTQTPDFALPTTACLIQDRLGIPETAGALDFNLGCSGFIYGLLLAKGLIETGQVKNVLLITAETYSKLIDPADKAVRTIFGDGAAATLVTACDDEMPSIGPTVLGTDGSGGGNLICARGGFRETESSMNGHSALWMHGPEIFNFTLRVVPECVRQLLAKGGLKMDDVDLFVFHQANLYILEHLRKKLGIPENKFVVAIEKSGNTVSSTIPIALALALEEGRLKTGQIVMLVGFGVGYSWGATLLRWK